MVMGSLRRINIQPLTPVFAISIRRDGEWQIKPAALVKVGKQMSKQVTAVLYVMAMVAIIVGVDVAFFRNRFWERLIVNIGIVLVFGAFYWRFVRPA
jgi:hypothetical protein